jgi:teichuronic acid biosynthesis glycosyltransferase TuaC
VRSSLLSFEHEDPDARVLEVTNMWARKDEPRYGIFVKRQVDSLIDAGLRCDVLFIRGYRSPLAYPLAALTLLAWNWRRKRRYALVHAHSGEAALAARFYLRAPVLATYYGSDLLGSPRADGTVTIGWRVRRWVIRQHARLLRASFTQSGEMQAALPRPARQRDGVMPSGVDRDLFAPLDRGEARRRVGWSDDERVALFAADPTWERKRYWLAKAACDLAGARLGSARLHVASAVPPEDMPILMSASDCLLLTSSVEGSPNVVKEALACNLPVVATPSGDVRELLDAVEPSWVCESAPESVAAALVECLREPRRSNGREASASLSEDRIAQRILRVYAELGPSAVGRVTEATELQHQVAGGERRTG